MADPIDSDKIAENAAGPQSAAGDGESVSQFSISDQIMADRYKKANDAASSNRWPIRMGALRPPGTQG